ncbi:hypothetical protein [Phreatobacter sp.]|uniref:hypothetical protein n=1 Tax=Phreatobacter sp. TaxID=1966341 RepID=UPI0025E32CD3|nr:hypothetical protein [Phreatobacter sp.]
MSAAGGETISDLQDGVAAMMRDEVVAPGGHFDTGILARLFEAMPRAASSMRTAPP